MQQLPDESVDLVVTSPPYNLLNSTGNGSRCWDGYDGHSDDMPHHAYVEWQRLCLAQMLRVLKPDGAIFYNQMHRVQGGLIVRHDDILQDFPLRQVIIWHRSGGTNFNPGYFLPDYEVIYLITKPKFRLLDGHTDGSVWRIHQETCSGSPGYRRSRWTSRGGRYGRPRPRWCWTRSWAAAPPPLPRYSKAGAVVRG